MASLTIKNLDDDVMDRLAARAAAHGRSPEEEVMALLKSLPKREAPNGNAIEPNETSLRMKRVLEKIESGEGVSDLGLELGEPALVGQRVRSPAEQKRVLEALRRLGQRPRQPYDLKALSDEISGPAG